MKTRTYNILKFFKGKSRSEELKMLVDENRDFEARRLFIEESELTLHVYFSRHYLLDKIAWLFIFISFLFLNKPIIFGVLFGFSIISKYFSFFYKRKYKETFLGYQVILACMDFYIQKEYGLILNQNNEK